MADDLSGIDYNQYGKWEAMTAPTGQVYYKVPGTGYLYDPFLSQSKGRPVLFQNPQPEIDAKRKSDKAAKRAGSPLAQAAPLVGAVGGTVLGKLAIDHLTPATPAEKLANAKATAELQQLGSQAPATVPVATPTTPAQAFIGPTQPPGAPEIVGATRAPGTLPDTSSMPTLGQVGQGALGAYQVYNGVNQFKNDKIGGSLNVASGGANIAAAAGSQMAGQVAAPLAIATGAYDSYQGLQHGGEGLRTGTTELGAGIGSFLLPGVGTAVGALAGNAIGYGLQGTGWKNDAALLGTTGGLALPLVVARHLGFNPIHTTTKQVEQQRWGKLEKDGVSNAGAAFMANHNGGSTWDTGPMAGKKWNFEDAQTLAKQDPTHFQHVFGNYDTFGNDWSTYSDSEQKAITAGLVNAGLYKSNKGDVLVSDKEAARKIKDQVLGITTTGPAAAQSGVGAAPTSNSDIGKQLANRLDQRR